MIQIFANRRDLVTTELVLRAFERCFTCGQVRLIDTTAALPGRNAIVVAIAPEEAVAPDIERIVRQGGKAILLGTLGPDRKSVV